MDGFMSAVFAAAMQGVTAAVVAALLSAFTEPVVNRVLVHRVTLAKAISETSFSASMKFFMTTFPTNMLKFPVFEVINRALAFTTLAGSLRGIITGFSFC